jgi:hypothetical protein
MQQNEELSPIFLKISPKDIVYLKAILESYDELGILRTLNPITGDVVILSLPNLKPGLMNLIEGLKSEIEFTVLETAPDGKKDGDWLIEENN